MAESLRSMADKLLRFLNGAIALPFIVLIYLYRIISPLKKYVFGPYAGCRFHPTCSAYAIECLRRFSLPVAIWKSFRRIARCNPMHPGGYDPVVPEDETPETETETC